LITLFYANLTKSVNEIRKFCLVLISCQNRTEQNMRSMSMRWDEIFFLWNETKQDFFSVRWNRIKFLFCEMRQNQILILWDETESNSHFVKWDETENESSSYEMRSNLHETECLILVLQSVYAEFEAADFSEKESEAVNIRKTDQISSKIKKHKKFKTRFNVKSKNHKKTFLKCSVCSIREHSLSKC